MEGGEVARDAGLTGMTDAERREVLDKMLVGKPYEAHKQMASVAEIAQPDIESQQPVPPSSSQTPAADDPFQSDSYTACAICIDHYDDTDEVYVGEDCNHMFHKDLAPFSGQFCRGLWRNLCKYELTVQVDSHVPLQAHTKVRLWLYLPLKTNGCNGSVFVQGRTALIGWGVVGRDCVSQCFGLMVLV